ncbi:MAG: CvpA family protein [Patescibacteria group bacterium]|nr:CvpA family protein [Patescibacteria group bacterium]
MNWADLAIFAAIILFAFMGYRKGVIRQVADLVTLVISLFLSVLYYIPLANYLNEQSNISVTLTKFVAFFAIWMGTQLILNIIFFLLYPLIPEVVRKSKINRFGGAFPGLVWGIVFVFLFVTVVSALPIQSRYRDDLINSVSGKYVIGKTVGFENYITDLIGGALDEALTFKTVKPNSEETTDLGFKVSAEKLTVDEDSENKMLELVNLERTKRGLRPLKMDKDLLRLARAHSRDMFERGYFAHVNPDGLDPFDRMREFEIPFKVAGENLALAPNVNLAHEGLMNSPGHRANILTAEFGLVGIGCIDGGSYGKMFSQEFTN